MRRILLRFQLTCDGEDSGCRQILLPSAVSEIQGPGLLNYNREKSKVSFDFVTVSFTKDLSLERKIN